METLEKVELIREKCNVSYEDAKAALDASNGDVLDAIIWLEKGGKTETASATYTTSADAGEGPVSEEQKAAQQAYVESTRKTSFKEDLRKIWNSLRQLLRRSGDYKFIADRYDEQVVNVPLIVPILGLFFWGATIWLLILGLFFNFRYRIEGPGSGVQDANSVMDHAADFADNIKKETSHND